MTNLKHAADCLLQWQCMSVQYVTYNGFVISSIHIILSIFFSMENIHVVVSEAGK